MYSPEQRTTIIDEICAKISSGLSLRKVLEGGKPISQKVFFEWIDADVEKSKQYARAAEARADSIFEDILDIADDSNGDVKYTEHGEVMNSEFVQRSRLRVDARKWMLAKMMPKKYGERIEQEISGKNGEPFSVNIIRTYETNQKTDDSN